MTMQEKQQFITDLVGSVEETLLKNVDRIPEAWDGHELRQLIADKFAEQTTSVLSGKRKKEYRNAVLVLNL